MTQALTERYGERIAGMLSCYDRLVITGTLPTVCYADGMTRYLNARGIRIFDYPEFAKALRERSLGYADEGHWPQFRQATAASRKRARGQGNGCGRSAPCANRRHKRIRLILAQTRL
jgi:hypothetical protein